MITQSKQAVLLLENGMEFIGKSFGKQGTVMGEVVFTTAMTGYQETITDPNYYGQIVTQTFPLIGNYGVNSFDNESDQAHLAGYIVREWCELPSNFRCEDTLDAFLKDKNVVGLYDIDTRALTKVLRENGVMNGVITNEKYEKKTLLQQLRQFQCKGAVQAVSSQTMRRYEGENASRHLVLFDCGYQDGVLQELQACGCDVTVVPCTTTAEQIKQLKPDGILLSNGPGNPEDYTEIVTMIQELIQLNLPIFGIGLGHQLMALANGATIEKLPYGHRGSNQPVKDVDSEHARVIVPRLNRGRTFVTRQNHGYVVVSESVDPEIAFVSHKNVNDGSCEGIRYHKRPILTLQFCPELCGGSNNTSYLFREFLAMVDGEDK